MKYIKGDAMPSITLFFLNDLSACHIVYPMNDSTYEAEKNYELYDLETKTKTYHTC